MSRSKIKTIIISTAALILTISISITMAYFRSEHSVKNKLRVSAHGIGIAVTEPSWVESKGQNLMPGDIVPKDPLITNNKEDAYARMIVSLKDAKSGQVIQDPVRAGKIMSMMYYATLPITEQKTDAQLAVLSRVNPQFTYDAKRSSVGVYYYNYNTVMQKGVSGQLFTGIVVPKNWGKEEIDVIGDFDIEITGQAIQAQNMLSPDQAFEALDNSK